MELTNEFRVGVPVDEAWTILTDVERIAPCMPGAQLQEIEGDEYRGIVKVKVGPISAQYKGKATFVEMDEANHRAVLRAEGRETRGQGNANATITASLRTDGFGTAVTVVTDLTVTGRVAQFGRGVLADVSAKLLDQFVACLESTVLVDDVADALGKDAEGEATPPETITSSSTLAEATEIDPHEPLPGERVEEPVLEEVSADEAPIGTAHAHVPDGIEPPHAAPTIRRIDSPEPKPVDLLDTAGAPVVKRLAPLVIGVIILWLLRRMLSPGGDA
jgi:carbon monoxide dehydrogenase subunit G